MKKKQLRTWEAILATFTDASQPSRTMFSWLTSWPEVKSKLAGLTLTPPEAS
jgi:hypothetical protein